MAEAAHSAQTEAPRAPASRRGAGFPVISLPAAVEIVHQAGQHGGDHSLAAFAGYAGHSTANSGPFRAKLAALKDWQLVSSGGERVVLTDLGKRFAREESPLNLRDALQDSFLGCKIFKTFYDDVAKGIPTKADTLVRRACLDFRVATASGKAFVASLAESAEAAGLAQLEDKGDTITFLSSTTTPTPQEESSPSFPESEDLTTKKQPSSADKRKDAPATAVVKQSWPTTHGEVVLIVNSSMPLPADAFSLIGATVTAAASLAEHLNGARAKEDDIAS
jgi:hypothetical protein